ncbi:MAG: hypothetical protein IJL17_02315 [Kiritimatiellae bacterium]|nr:hypothetical protein [Kiritimatiellia bacterium]
MDSLKDNEGAIRRKYVPSSWRGYNSLSWAANWHKWFNDDATDSRGKMGWPNYFSTALARAGTVYNYYSTGDPIFLESDTVPGVTTGIFHWPTLSLSWPFIDFNITAEEGSWQKQGLFKGRGGIGGTSWSGWNIDENIFGINKISVAEAQTMTEVDFRTNTVFYCYPPSMNQPTIPLLVRGAHLALGIPALTPAAGRVKFQGWDAMTNFDLNSKDVNLGIPRPNAWPNRSNYQGQWCHSDLRDVAYFYVFKFYDKAIEKGNLR